MAVVDQALRLLEILFLLIPVVAILLQAMISFYSKDDVRAAEWKKGIAFTAAIFGLIFFGYAGTLVIQLMSQNGANQTLVNAANAALLGLAAVAVGVIITISDIFGSSETGATGSDEHQRSSTDSGSAKLITEQGREIPLEDQAQLDRVREAIDERGET